MPGISNGANRPWPSIPTRSFSWMRIFLHHLSSRSPSFDKCLEKCSKKFTVTGADEPTNAAASISNDRPQLAQPKQIAFVVLAGVRAGLWGLPHGLPIRRRQPVRTGLDGPRGSGCLAAENRSAGDRG